MHQWFHKKLRYRLQAILLGLLTAGLIAAALLQEGTGGWYLPAALAAAALMVFIHLLMPVFRRKYAGVSLPGKIWHGLLVVITPCGAMALLQNFTLDPWRIYPRMILANLFFFYLFYLFLTFLTGSFARGYVFGDLVTLILGTANYFVVQFRGSPIVPWDLFSLRTAASVANNYSYEITWRFVFSAFGLLLLLVLDAKVSAKARILPVRFLGLALCAFGLVFGTAQLQKAQVKEALGMDVTLFTPNVRYRNNGFVAAFLGNLHLINVQEPKGYSVERTREIARDTRNAHLAQAQGSTRGAAGKMLQEGTLPNIIVIMDEAFSDLQVLGSFETNQDYMPNFRRLMEGGSGGYLMVSVRGGNTANTEFEFLTGDSMAFLPSGSVVYQQFVRDNLPALPAYLAGLGYSTLGIHPYLGSGWDREKVYPLLGFQDFLTQDDFENPDRLRLYISDAAAFAKVIEEFEKGKAQEGPRFIFEVTMQNHSGYSKEYPGFTEEITLPGLSYSNVQTRAAEKYLTLIYESDQALGEMMDYFETVTEPTIVLMFGDHQPSDYVTAVIERLVGYDPERSLQEAQKAYQVPYFVWNNFGMDFEAPKLVSVNYLAADILQAAQVPLTTYQTFLLDQQKVLPVLSGGAYIDSAGVYHSYDEADPDNEAQLNAYNVLQYNHMTDIKNRVTDIFSECLGDANAAFSL